MDESNISILDSEGNMMGTLEFTTSISDFVIFSDITSSGSWGPYFYYGYTNSKISWQEELAIDIAVGIIIALITGGLAQWIGIASGIIGSISTTIAIEIFNTNTKNLRYSRYASQWVGCPILIRDRIQIHNQTMTRFFGTKYINPYWVGSKWDYNQPPECRQAPY